MRTLTMALVCLITNFAQANELACSKLDELRKSVHELEQQVLLMEELEADSDSCQPESEYFVLTCGAEDPLRQTTKLMRKQLDSHLKKLRQYEQYCSTQ